MRTLPTRLERISRTTQQVVDFVNTHPKIERVTFPLDKKHPQYELAKKQMKGACGMLTIILKNNSFSAIATFCESLQHFLMAVSWGGHESLVYPKCASLNPEQYNPENIEHRIIRLYIGLEEGGLLNKRYWPGIGQNSMLTILFFNLRSYINCFALTSMQRIYLFVRPDSKADLINYNFFRREFRAV